MKRVGTAAALVLAIVALGLLVSSMFVVRVDQFAIVIQFGAPKRVITEPGLYFKTPFIQVVQRLDKRIQSWDDQPQEVVTLDKKRIYISSFGRWAIVDPLRFYTAVRDENAAQMNLDKIIGGNIREVVSTQILDSLVRDTNRPLTYVSEESERSQTMTEVRAGGGRTNILDEVFKRGVTELEATFGIGLIDVDIKQLNYTESAQQATIRQMISEREKVAARYEAEGRRDARTIRGETDEAVRTLLGDAERQRLTLEGQANAEGARIRAQAFSMDPEFFSFAQTLDVYRDTIDEKTRFVLSTDTPIFRLLEDDGVLSDELTATVIDVDTIETLIDQLEADVPDIDAQVELQ